MRRSLLPLLLLLATGLALPAPAPAARGMEVAIQDDGVFLNQYWYSREQALQRAKALGVTRIRVNAMWARVVSSPNARRQPRALAYNWAPFDTLIADAARYGMALEITLVGPAPRWAAGNRKVGQVRPNAAKFGRFARDVAQHFAGRVDRYSIWNEPNWHYWLQPSQRCRSRHWAPDCDRAVALLYRSLYRRSYNAIKAVDPDAEVLFGELAPRGRVSAELSTPPLQFLRTATCSRVDWSAARRCDGLDADGFAHHPYAIDAGPTDPPPGPDDVTLSSLGRLTFALDRLARRGALEQPNGRRLDLHLTEHGYFRAGRFKVPSRTHAKYLRKSFDIALRHPRVKQMLQYLLVRPPRGRDTFPTHILSRKGGKSAPYRALAAWARKNRRRIAPPAPLPAPAQPTTPAPQPRPAPPPALIPVLPG